ncbi:LytTR family transcriptional regulator DNA-binding domain-containing protein [Algoriphagus aestuarii]|uniref:LytTR family transcriptional regulator DNA-binding domain-containing protein n=1 Tax=Algoriphagus pacificus TaxID=2811234 RepID=A0ABS3CK65_9BACT|nr:LytTR family transcriptional regulator DNA-binding domain-containing protein [Algoriphagus pacificus]MBN3584845.1 LytTR family transcriptional regulator DNA-binding domain-containing protein [Algoriphagus aestuarii]MBN7817482.1 LytTR family transcriptional regulator DNA-binding domain-containing protein [Algoriphagus pacificus]
MGYKKQPIKYQNQGVRIALCILAAVLVAMFGSGAKVLDSLSNQAFYIKLIATLIISGFFIEFVHTVTVRLDKIYDWKEKPLIRFSLQFMLGIFLPGLIDFLFLSLYKWYFNLTVRAEESAQVGYSAMLVPIFLFNFYYLVHYHLLKNKDKPENSGNKKRMFMVQQGSRVIPVKLEEIRMIYHEDRLNYLITAAGKKYYLNESLEKLEELLPQEDFFRINRKMIIHYLACQHFQSNGHGKFQLKLIPEFHEDVFVTQSKSSLFKEWIKR